MYYYFYDIETYKVYATYFIKPSDNMLVNAHIVSDVYFEEKEGLYKDLTIDKDSLEIKCNYFEINASNINLADKISILEAENKILKQELSITQDAVNELIFNSLNM